MLKTTAVLKMLDLNKTKITAEPEDITGYVAQRLRDLEIYTVEIPGPTFQLEQANGASCFEVVSKIADDLDYAIAAINEYNPIVVFLREVTKEPSGKYKFRFQYLAEYKGHSND